MHYDSLEDWLSKLEGNRIDSDVQVLVRLFKTAMYMARNGDEVDEEVRKVWREEIDADTSA